MTCTRPHILIVSDHMETRKEFVCRLPRQGYQAVVTDDTSALSLVTKSSFDVAVIHTTLSSLSSRELGARLRAQDPRLEVLILTEDNVPEDGTVILHSLSKSLSPEQLLSAVQAAYTRRRVRLALDSVLPQCPSPTDDIFSTWSKLTDQEWKVLDLMIDGMTDCEIANHLHVCSSTVNTHVCNILHKLQVGNRVQAVVLAMQHGLLIRKIHNLMDRQPDTFLL